MKLKTTSKPKRRKHKFNYQLGILALPGFLFLVAFYLLPLGGLFIPFKRIDYAKGIFQSDWVGFQNFEFFFKSQDFARITRNTLLLNLLFIIVGAVLAILVALILYEMSKAQVRIFQTALFMPYFVSWIVVGYILFALISTGTGLIPKTIFYLTGKEIDSIYLKPNLWPGILLVASIWKGIGYNTIMYYTSLLSLDSSYVEAAVIDGANRWQRIWYICLPHIKPMVTMLVLLSIGKICYADFGMFYFLPRNSGVLYSTTDVIDTYVYRALTTGGDLGMTAAVCLYQSLFGLVLLLCCNFIVKKVNPENSIF